MISRQDTRTSECQVKTRLSACLLIVCIGVVVGYGQEELPDNYLPISFKIQDEKLEGGCEYLQGFTFSMDLPTGFLEKAQ